MLALRRFSLPPAILWLALTCLTTSSRAQTRAADASAVGGFPVLAPITYSMPAALDGTVLPGCVATASDDCNTQIAGRIYLPAAIRIDDGVMYPILVLLHGNHLTCGRPYNPATDRADLNSTPPPHIDDDNRYAGLGACPGGVPVYTVVPSYQGLDYLGNRLASYGYAVISVDANRGIGGLNQVQGVANDLGLILARGRLVLRHLQTLSGWNDNIGTSNPFLGGIDLFQKLDFTGVGMFGHSRGGEGVMAAYNLYFSDPAGANWRARIGAVGFQGIYELAPTDIRNFLGDPQDSDDVAWNSLLPGCDGDVETLDGMHPFDRMLDRGASSARISTYLVWGVNHNFYNDQWQTTDGIDTRRSQQNVPAPTCYSPPNLRCVDPNVTFPDNTALFGNSIFTMNRFRQQNSLVSSLTAFFRSTVDAGTRVRFDANFNPLVGVPGTVTNPMGAVRLYPTSCIEREYSRPPVSLTDIDDFSQPEPFNSHSTAAMPVRNSTGGATILQYQHSFGVVDLNDPTQRIARIRWRYNDPALPVPFFQDNWTPAGSGRDIRGNVTLDFRIARQVNDVQNLNPGVSTDFSIYLVSGSTPPVYAGPVRLSTALGQGFASLTGPLGEALSDSKITFHPYMETARIRLSAFHNLAAVQGNLRGVLFYFNRTTTGAIFLADITLSPDLGPGIPATGAPTPISESQPQLLTTGSPPSGPIVHAGTMTSMQSGVRVYSVDGVAHSGGVKLEFASADPFPAGDAPLILKIGSSFILTGNLVDLYHAVFTLTPEEFASVRDGDPVILQKGFSKNPSQIWDFGRLNKSLAQPQK
jgi:hypothetical protein